MKYFFYRLNAPRVTFASDMTSEEAQIMQRHLEYWAGQLQQGKMLAFGPVADPKSSFGVGIIMLADGEDPQSLAELDPAITAKAGFTFEIYAMPKVMHVSTGKF